MSNLVVKQIWFVSLVCFAFVNTKVTIENGGYSVLVSFSQNVKSTEGWDLLEKMKESLEKASSILHDAIGRQFIKVTFEIPEYWDISQTNITLSSSSFPKYAKPDFLIDGTNDVIFGKFPYAQQYGGCGIPGLQITIPTAFFADDNKFPRGTALAREWLKYRYGVFDENGYKEDTLYPLYRRLPLNENSELSVTDCTNNPVAYNLQSESEAFSEDDQTSNISPQSKLVPDKNTLENVTSSIMYFHQDIPDLLHICGKDSNHPHNALSPNKHNAMCHSQSIWEVVRKSEDFRTGTDSEKYRDIVFIYAQERRLKIVIAWENTQNVGLNKGKVICKTIKRFAYELPQGTKFNAFPFSDTLSSERDYTLKELKDLNDKNAIMADIMSDFVKTSNGNITIAVDKALEILRSDSSNSEPEGTIIVISKSGEDISSILLKISEKYDVCLKILSLSEGITHQAGYYNSASPCGFPEDILIDNNEDMFKQLFASMETILPATVDDKITETRKTGYLSQNASISLEVDDTVEKVTFWLLTKKELENFKMTFNQRIENLQALKTTTDIMALSFNPQEAGSIEIAFPHQTDPILTQVRVTFKAGKYLNGFLYIHDTTTENCTHQMPVIIYAVIRYGAYPVQNAKVTATIERPEDENPITLVMLDDGRGDPDITGNDGVYSRYFTQFNKEGEYIVIVTVEITDLTPYGVDENADYLTCCGSFLKTASSQIKGTKKYFFKTFFFAKSGRPDEGYKPSRITDLRIGNVVDDKIVLKWSAPGEEGDSGTVSHYEIKLFCKKENSTDCSASNMIQVINKSLPFSYGTEQEATIQILIKTHSLFAGIITYNDKNKTSDLSNIIQIFESPETTVKITTYPETSIHSGTVIGIVIVCVLVIICLAIAIIFYIKRKPPYTEQKDKELEEDMNTNDQIKITFKETNFSIKTVPMKKVESFPVMLYTHDQIKDRRDKCKDPPLYKAHLSPKPWASLDHLSSMKAGQYNRDTVSLGSSSTISATEESHSMRK